MSRASPRRWWKRRPSVSSGAPTGRMSSSRARCQTTRHCFSCLLGGCPTSACSAASWWTTRPRSTGSRRLLDLDAGGLDHLRPAREVLADEGGELLGRIADRLHAERREALLDRRGGERRHGGAVDPGNDLLRQADRADDAGDVVDLE